MMPHPRAGVRSLIRRWVVRGPVRYKPLRDDLVSANMGVTLDRYLMRSLLMSGLFGAVWAALGYLALHLAVLPSVSVGIHNVFGVRLPELVLTDASIGALRVLASIFIFFIAAYAAYLFFLTYPAVLKKSRATKINLLLHNAVAYIYAMRRGGAEMITIFRSIAEESAVYGEVAHEFRRVVRDTDYFGCDLITALRHLQETTPSEKLRDFLQDLVSVVESGGDVLGFLEGRVRVYQDEARFEQKSFLNTLQLAAESYVTLFVAGPLFIIIVMVVMGLMSSTPVAHLSVVVYLLIPVGSLFFVLFIDAVSFRTEKVERYTSMKWLDEFDDVRVQERDGEEDLVRELRRYDRVRKYRSFLRHPLQAFLIEPNRTFYVTVPIALGYILLTLLATPAYPDVEVLIDVLDDHVVVALLIVLLPFGIFYQLWRRRVTGIEAGIPDFLDRLSGINQVGLTLAQAISLLVKANLGVLAYEIRKVKRDIDWGASVQEALVRFEERIRTPAIARTVTLITKASMMTGDIGEVLAIASRDAAMTEALKRERRAEMFIYTVIVYLVFFVFLFVVVVIDIQFFSVLAEIDAVALAGAAGSLSLGSTPIATFERLLYHGCLIQAFFSGLIAGEMGEASLRAGVKHAAVMIIVAFVVFTVFL